MSDWAPKRFWKSVEIKTVDGGFAVTLDGRNVRTPGKALLAVPTEAMARHIANEWEAQTEKVDPRTMPWTRSANSAIDKLSVQRREVEDHLIGYAGTDLVCYRAESPQGLVERQAQGWDPILDNIEKTFGVRFLTASGVMPVPQAPESLDILRNVMSEMSDFAITGFHDIVTLSGSYLIAVSVTLKAVEPKAAWQLSRIDEDWQIEQWGRDEEADAQAETKREAFMHATHFFTSA
ncbi:ATP12 family chaperone protein [Boseongicola aestuarii]|uniref:ATP12 chaperone protein n=1 Tax=Boseongicola aestuarii TaxID=1470561 RepID=A0A238J599_9RHOB|nr:ATP12 family protein [Boseongicola aestuarii]SMX25402.1 ATP12 chaperone protein [Boseongicola aestuarii]